MNDPTFDAVFGTGARDQLVKLFSYVGHYSDTVTVRTNGTDCITVQACNPSHTVMVFAHIDFELFDTFTGRGEISCSVKSLVAILKLSETPGTFRLQYESAKLVMSGGLDQYSIPTMTIDTEAFTIPEDQIEKVKAVQFEEDPNMTKLFSLLKSWQAAFQPTTLKLDMNPIEDPEDFTQVSDFSVSIDSDMGSACKSFYIPVEGPSCQVSVSSAYFVDTSKLKLDKRCIGYDPSGSMPLMVADAAEHLWVRTFIAPIMDE